MNDDIKNGINTMDDVARALNISKSTVSRAVSGKGRMKEETRQRILDFIEETNFRPNSIAKSLVQRKTYNIGFTIPKNYSPIDIAFFQNFLYGITESASEANYDVVTTVVMEDDQTQLHRLVEKRKVDGIIVGRSWENHSIEKYLKENSMPFLMIGLTEIPDVCQFYQDHEKACRCMADSVLDAGMSVMLIGGDSQNRINQDRLAGFEKAVKAHSLPGEKASVRLNCYSKETISCAVDDALEEDRDCIICMDDFVCNIVLEQLAEKNVLIPERICVASCYKSDFFDFHQPAISTVEFNAEQMGRIACETLFRIMDGAKVPLIMQDCTLSLQKSTYFKRRKSAV